MYESMYYGYFECAEHAALKPCIHTRSLEWQLWGVCLQHRFPTSVGISLQNEHLHQAGAVLSGSGVG